MDNSPQPKRKKVSPVAKEAKKAQRKLVEHRRTRPEQLLLFEFNPEESHYSNTIELYDAIPKYYWGKPARIEGRFLDSLNREFVHKSKKYRVIIQPTKLKDADGIEKDCLPGQREEIIEDALRKFATEGRGFFLDNEAGVIFSLYELRKELESKGHTYSLQQIKDALTICGSSTMRIEDAEGKQASVIAAPFTTVGLATQEDWKGHGQKSKAFVKFHPLVTKCIKEKSFRQINYESCMSYKQVLARWLHKRMSHNYIQASVLYPYSISATTIIRDSGIKSYRRINDNIRKIESALKEMIESGVLQKYEAYTELDETKKNKIIDCRFELRPSMSFIREMKKANERLRQIHAENGDMLSLRGNR